MVLTIRTDRPKAEIGLFKDGKRLAYKTWEAHRQLSETIHKQIQNLLISQGVDWKSLKGIICYEGPGSFTGLRIGITVANTLAYSLEIPVSGQTGHNWIEHGIKSLLAGKNDKQVLPIYGADANITAPKNS